MTSLVVGLCLSAPAQPPVVVQLPPPTPVPVAPALTLDQFSRVFTPAPGKHSVCLIHPRTCQPVHVCFTLPDCTRLKRFEVTRRTIEFDFGRQEVEIIFRLNGTVDVKYRG
jgi:hypothetical protein